MKIKDLSKEEQAERRRQYQRKNYRDRYKKEEVKREKTKKNHERSVKSYKFKVNFFIQDYYESNGILLDWNQAEILLREVYNYTKKSEEDEQ